jgi:hypothetical protein
VIKPDITPAMTESINAQNIFRNPPSVAGIGCGDLILSFLPFFVKAGILGLTKFDISDIIYISGVISTLRTFPTFFPLPV